MVEEIYKLKNKIIDHVESETQNMGRIDVKEIGELVDMIKDLAEAEKSCWEASYYRKVTEAMEGPSGYSQSRMGYGQQASSRSGYSQQMGYGSMGHDDLIGKLGEEFKKLTPEEKTMMKNKVFSTLGMV